MKQLTLCLAFLTLLIISGCSPMSELTSEELPESEKDVAYTLIYYVHADSDYLYHTTDNKPIRQNSKVLETAFDVGETALSGEVFIYHQRSEKKLLGLFPRRSSRFYHYKGGQLVTQVKYRHQDKNEDLFATEVQLMNQYKSQDRSDNHQNYFVYFGHELPTENGKGYHQSLPEIAVSTTSFARGIQKFLLSDEDRFDLIVLSTCNNGTPSMVKLLMPLSVAVLASPQNLHLSHIDSASMNLLEMEPGISPFELGRSMAEQTFQQLKETVQTTITLALYDLNEVQPYIDELTSITYSNRPPERTVQFQDNVDCTVIYPSEPDLHRQGVETWYKPARFGRQSGQSTHSGWGCKPNPDN